MAEIGEASVKFTAIAESRSEAQASDILDLFLLLETLLSPGRPLMLSAVVLVPLFYNPNSDGTKKPIEAAKFEESEREVQRHFSGYSHFIIGGWYRDETTSDEFRDRLLRMEIDFVPDRVTIAFFKAWKETLCRRFQQRDIYLRLSGPVVHW